MTRTLTKIGVLSLALAAFAQPTFAEQWQYNNVERVVAISDIHGAYGAMVETLQSAAVIDDALSWSGGHTHLVIVGDILDRGPDSRRVMDLLMRLEDEAVSAGGQVHVLIGNHEAMNLVGDLRYVSPAEYAAFADDELGEDREHWFNVYRDLRAPADANADDLRAAFDEKYPSGFFAHRRAFSGAGKYGQWLLSKPVVVVINGTAFVHGGLSPMIAEIGLRGVNEVLVGEVATYLQQLELVFEQQLLLPTDAFFAHVELLSGFTPSFATEPGVAEAVADVIRLNDSAIHAKDGPLWYRGNVDCNRLIEVDRLDQSLAAIGAKRVVIGHTPTFDKHVLERFDGRIVEVDTGMLSDYYGGSGNALILESDRLYVVNQSSGEAVPPAPHPRQVGRRPGAPMLVEDIELLLQSGDVIAHSEDESGRVIVAVSNGEHTVDAEFVKARRRGIYPDVAAYRLDRLLDFNMVPVTVRREIDGKGGSLQFVPIRWIDEQQRQQDQSGGGAWCSLPEQWNAMSIFDVLIGNGTRSTDTIRYDLNSFLLMLAGHEQAFTSSGSRPARYKDAPLQINPAWAAALNSLTDEVLQQRFADVLDKRRIKALAKRRDLLLSE